MPKITIYSIKFGLGGYYQFTGFSLGSSHFCHSDLGTVANVANFFGVIEPYLYADYVLKSYGHSDESFDGNDENFRVDRVLAV
ncbi:MAG: hypothetical protein HRU19_12375 [Pseudobacteriovorax sp.]|nr:hypothetical protein [Pseudobacteriovorax sp.]